MKRLSIGTKVKFQPYLPQNLKRQRGMIVAHLANERVTTRLDTGSYIDFPESRCAEISDFDLTLKESQASL